MLLAGDEHGHSQQGNNNAYCQDNSLTWLDWKNADDALTDFTAALIHLRQQIPALTDDRWWQEGDGNVQWLNQDAQPLSAEEWQHGARRMQILLLMQRRTRQTCSYPWGNGALFLLSPAMRSRWSWLSGMGPRTEFAYFKGHSL